MTKSRFIYWKKLTSAQIKERIATALEENVDFRDNQLIGVPASHLDPKVFYSDSYILKEAPFLNTLVRNPNHIGCHTLGNSEPFFSGTQKIERELIEICAVDILGAEPGSCDGYVASGGTEANIQAIWIYRNFFVREHKAKNEQIAIICSTDAHYSMYKAADLLGLDIELIPISEKTREIERSEIFRTLEGLRRRGKQYIIAVTNMMTTMFGSVDDPDMFAEALSSLEFEFKIHVDGAYGGFLYPFMCDENKLGFSNPLVNSVTLDAHKLVQAPYGTGIFLVRKGYMKHVYTKEAQYVKGLDATLSGSRSGANAIAVWMILSTYGPHGWYEKNQMLMMRTNWVCEKLDEIGVEYYRNPTANIITIKAGPEIQKIAGEYGLVPDSHGDQAKWYKIVVMEHVTLDKLASFLSALLAELNMEINTV
ncbi:MAG: aspartate aminotransferase family protein [Saprospirales bacterium]|nr:MAG: aspartate aminotransferase family protein [Saprospirales bacterium]